ncbi:hypothetical protein BT67DRAFT_168794 [Trichocladium antarcticum]|uniref:Uncharacterized protein n=1 Tax=Trichocladium antarcticum TaxID=1450529 RepID=A0AAN6UDL1_9PEZI|nr:hypothetical protein BT67DRAFT_168794 [Trichocladium antarcticum]
MINVDVAGGAASRHASAARWDAAAGFRASRVRASAGYCLVRERSTDRRRAQASARHAKSHSDGKCQVTTDSSRCCVQRARRGRAVCVGDANSAPLCRRSILGSMPSSSASGPSVDAAAWVLHSAASAGDEKTGESDTAVAQALAQQGACIRRGWWVRFRQCSPESDRSLESLGKHEWEADTYKAPLLLS